MIREARTEDDGALRALVATLMLGKVSLSFTTEPSFFKAIQVHGDEARVLVAERGGVVQAMGTIARRRVYLNGSPGAIGYLAGLRISPQGQKGSILARGYQFFERVHREELHLPFYLTSIMEGNTVAKKLLTSRRAGLPCYAEVGKYSTFVLSTAAKGLSGRPERVDFLWGNAKGKGSALRCLEECGPRKQFFPVFDRAKWDEGVTGLPGICPGDFLVAVQGNSSIGTLALWDQRGFRQIRIMEFSPKLEMAGAFTRVFLGKTHLPRVGEPLPFAFIAAPAFAEEDPALFRSMLGEVLHRAVDRGISWLGVGFFEGDPFGESIRPLASWILDSRIYTVGWDEGPDSPARLDGRQPFLDLGSL